jgi:hypothetical protein
MKTTNNFRTLNAEQLSEVKGGRYIYIIAPDGTRYRVWI